MYNQGNKAVSPTGTMNGHCSQGVAAFGTQVPGPVDNVPLVEPDTRKVSTSQTFVNFTFFLYN